MAEAAAATDGDLSGAQRAAILVMYLDRDVARSLLRQLDDDDVLTRHVQTIFTSEHGLNSLNTVF